MRFFLLLLFLTSCTYKKPAEECLKGPLSDREKIALTHPLYSIIPRHSAQIRIVDIPHRITWMLFGNDDDGIFGEGKRALYKIEKPISGSLALMWGIRNPLHNFTHYVIGTAYTTNKKQALIDNDGCFMGLHGYKPFLRLKSSKSEFYIGWRERGNFGLKLIPYKRYNGGLPNKELYVSKEG